MREALVVAFLAVAHCAFVELYASYDRNTALCVGKVLINATVPSGVCTSLPGASEYEIIMDNFPKQGEFTVVPYKGQGCTSPWPNSNFTKVYGSNIPMFTGNCVIVLLTQP